MMNYAWLTDIHLDHIRTGSKGIQDFILRNKSLGFDDLFITGDISTSYNIRQHLRVLSSGFDVPIYFVLGNHDMWGSSIRQVRDSVEDLSDRNPDLHYLSSLSHLQLSPTTAIVGHDGWYDGLHGEDSNFVMHDWLVTKDFEKAINRSGQFHTLDRKEICRISWELALEATDHIERGIGEAIENGFQNIIVLTHVPPWKEAHVHQGQPGEAAAHPWFTSRGLGVQLGRLADAYPHINFSVLCGHTHGKTTHPVKPNLVCRVGASTYGDPVVQDILQIDLAVHDSQC